MGYPVITSSIDAKGRVITKEVYDRGTYIETITKVSDGQRVDIYVDKEPKRG